MKLQPLFQFYLHPEASVRSCGGLTACDDFDGGALGPGHSPSSSPHYPGRLSVLLGLGFHPASMLAVTPSWHKGDLGIEQSLLAWRVSETPRKDPGRVTDKSRL